MQSKTQSKGQILSSTKSIQIPLCTAASLCSSCLPEISTPASEALFRIPLPWKHEQTVKKWHWYWAFFPARSHLLLAPQLPFYSQWELLTLGCIKPCVPHGVRLQTQEILRLQLNNFWGKFRILKIVWRNQKWAGSFQTSLNPTKFGKVLKTNKNKDKK